MQLHQYLIQFLIVLVLAVSCNKKIDVQSPDGLDILVNNQRSKVQDTMYFNLGDTVKFIMQGNVDNILFYSGEPGRQYEQNSLRTVSGVVPQLSFTSASNLSSQTNTLKVLVTNKVNVRDSASIVAASWTDITSRINLATNATAVNSGIVDLSEFASGANDSLFIAFQYNGVTGTLQRNWTISNLAINTLLTGGVAVTQLTNATAANYWKILGNVSNPANARWTATSTQLQIIGGGATAASNTSWIVSQPVFVGIVDADKPVIVKFTNSALPVYTISGITYSGYNHIYQKSGLYKTTFQYFNKSIDDQKTLIKEFYIRVI